MMIYYMGISLRNQYDRHADDELLVTLCIIHVSYNAEIIR